MYSSLCKRTGTIVLSYNKAHLLLRSCLISDDRQRQYHSSDKSCGSASSHEASYHSRYRRSFKEKKSKYDKSEHSSNNMISSKMVEQNHYDRLNIDREADQKSIKSAYYKLSKKHHPDVAGSDSDSGDIFRLVTESYDVLSDPNLKEEYDRQLEIKLDLKDIQATPSGGNFNDHLNKLYRTRDADMIFRRFREAALERERLMNPSKFKAGSFKRDIQDQDIDRQYRSVSRQLYAMDRSSWKNPRDEQTGSDLYRMNLSYILMRRCQDLQEASDESRYSRKNQETDPIPILFFATVMLGFLIAITFAYADMDITRNIERKCENMKRRMEERNFLDKSADP